VPVRSDSPPVCPSAQSGRDHRAVSLFDHLLTTGIWHRLKNTPGLVGRSGWARSPLRRLRSIDVEFTQLAEKQSSRTAALAVFSR
jgi:hypothetical protein